MENKSRCGGCILVSMCSGHPRNIVINSNVTLCPHCIQVRYYGRYIDLAALCGEFYAQLVGASRILVCLTDPNCLRREEELQANGSPEIPRDMCLSMFIDYEERPHG